ncbi:MAG: site-specific DNA-methyltransferase, partial [Anaerolineae bacterium]|nr:site-specific DNA-methyltransferase [Anaerolineae bacterium]
MEKSKLRASKHIREQLTLGFCDTVTVPSARLALSERVGTFQDSLRAPIHRWFKYPAGFSYKLVEALIEDYRLDERHWILDPFVGCGTTAVVAKERGVNCVGIEAHPFVFQVAQVKTFWEFDLSALYQRIESLLMWLHKKLSREFSLDVSEFPDLVHKCYSRRNLAKLKIIRDTIESFDCSEEERNFFRLALTDTLRTASSAGTGWPYVAPSQYHSKQSERDGLQVFSEQVRLMFDDLKVARSRQRCPVEIKLLQMDARQEYPLEAACVDLAVTSPPYLNNYDYADRTRLEMYFWGWAKSWGEITEQVRDKLITAATTQIRRSDFPDEPLDVGLRELDAQVYTELRTKIRKLKQLRLEKGGKKSYDLMVAGYFNDMCQVLRQVCRVLKPYAPLVLSLIHI